MSILSDKEIKQLCTQLSLGEDINDETRAEYKQVTGIDLSLPFTPMIEPFVPFQMKTELINSEDFYSGKYPGAEKHERAGSVCYDKKIVSYGLSSYGYDLRCGNKFKIFTNVNSTVIDPKKFDEKSFVEFEGDICIIPPNSFVLCASLERIKMPKDVTGVVLGKSTYARTGISCLATPLEAGWEGYVTLEFANTTPLPAMLYAGEGCCQVLFFKGSIPCEVSYADRGGKYNNQAAGPVTARV